MVPITNEAAKVHLISCFADALQQSMDAKLHCQWSCAASTTTGRTSIPAVNQASLAMQVHLRGTLHGELRIEITAKDSKLLLADEVNASSDPRMIWQELMESLIQKLPKRAVDTGKFAFSVESHGFASSSDDGTQIGSMELGQANGAQVMLRVLADDELTESLQVAEWSTSQNGDRLKSKDAISAELGRVIDVPLTVTLRFGQRHMRLCEVLELNAGTLVELDRQVEEPVDLILDERVIARGEVVIVDGNYGLRVTEIVERHPAMI